MPLPTAILSIQAAEKSHGKTRALRGLSLDLFPGELLGLLGPNGAGKTSLIRCLAGRSRLDKGAFTFATGTDAPHSLGVVPQSIAVYQDLTAQQNLVAFGKLHAVDRHQLGERVDQALQWANLTDRRHHLVRTFSGGMQRRLNIACSVLHHPAILLLDEPTVGVDPQSRSRIYEMIDELRDRGTAILLTTHQLDEAQYRCDRIAIVDLGKVVCVGTLDELIASTVGHCQLLRIRFQHVVDATRYGLSMDDSGTTGTCVISDPATQLAEILTSLDRDQHRVGQVLLQQPTLEDVFLHLTGKELRE
ncbi:ABC superfamily ATP binding cassette transporter, ABC protein SagG [Rhodopirellula maiorica SM1]|uniref:ABC superfamily ATP binding cassette transporter, ABC protein SagG n=1 Tax=Rhodopirellula maiorica SM1 TaxID=1265738 RepID=M5RKN1_9BACT|nr:ATP-binding cassette domain-containing protein [Rhodopirellula maiorica]EMI19860.1 ABC superfamily ATP binding cassette transporter, ABC protein SagG [Rhodopirellula maiorica SM1]